MRWNLVIATAPMRISAPLKSTSPPTTLMASVTFDITSRIVSRISWKSITDTFGKRSTRSCWKRVRSTTPPGPRSGATKVCGA